MICFHDVTFCPFHKECAKGASCKYALTDTVLEEADAWFASWSKNPDLEEQAPIMQYSGTPVCFMPNSGGENE